MYPEHPDLPLTVDPDTRIWRYSTFTRFLSLRERRAFFFSRIAALQRPDPFEGSLPRANVAAQEAALAKLPEQGVVVPTGE